MSAGSRGRKESIKVGGIAGVGTSEIYKCSQPECDREFASNLALIDHVIDIHGATAARVWGCRRDGCDLTFRTRGERDGHEDIGHRIGALPEEPQTGPVLPKGPSPAERARIRRPKGADMSTIEGRVWGCDECPKRFTSERSLEFHARSHRAARGTFTCPEPDCGRSFPSASALGGHRASHSRVAVHPTADDLIEGFAGDDEPDIETPEPEPDAGPMPTMPIETPEPARGAPPARETPERVSGVPTGQAVGFSGTTARISDEIRSWGWVPALLSTDEIRIVISALDNALDVMRDGGVRPETPAEAREAALTLSLWARLTEALEESDAEPARRAAVPVG